MKIVFLAAVVVISGAILSVLEILGSRMLMPYYGHSLFLNTALVMLIFLKFSPGYPFRRIISNKAQSPLGLLVLLLLAGT